MGPQQESKGEALWLNTITKVGGVRKQPTKASEKDLTGSGQQCQDWHIIVDVKNAELEITFQLAWDHKSPVKSFLSLTIFKKNKL